jgi:integrase
MGKRGNGEGTISRRKNGGWMAQYHVHTSEERRRKTLYGKTRKDVAKKLARALSDREGGAAPKTKSSRRRVSLTRGAVDALRAHLARQLEEIDRAGSLWQENGLAFASEIGEPLDRRDLTSRRFKPLLKRAKLSEKTRFHDLRHTCATLLLTKNVNPKIVSEMLGHATIAITLDTYSHVLPNMQDSAARALEEALR